MSDKDVKIELEQEECYCGIPEFYNLIARKLGYKPQKVQFDCTKICVSKAVQNQIFNFYKIENEASETAIGQTWVKYGPKANLPHAACVVSVEKGFIIEEA